MGRSDRDKSRVQKALKPRWLTVRLDDTLEGWTIKRKNLPDGLGDAAGALPRKLTALARRLSAALRAAVRMGVHGSPGGRNIQAASV